MAGIYIHIPFCKQACHYCNFHFSTSLARKESFILALLKEISLRKKLWQGFSFDTIYFGGGTPSLLTPSDLDRIFNAIYRDYDMNTSIECTIEANPDDITVNLLDAWRPTPINRISLGIQSFFDDDLIAMNRSHSGQQAHNALNLVRHKNFDSISCDLIYGMTTLSDNHFIENINLLIEHQIEHISAYALTVEKNTALDHFIAIGNVPPVDDADQSRHFNLLTNALQQAGYDHYEISNFSKPGYHARHNTSYWNGIPYIGFGPSAHTYLSPMRRWNVANNNKYIQSLKINKVDHEFEILSQQDQYNEKLMTGLRTKWGIKKSTLINYPLDYQKNFDSSIARHIQSGHIIEQPDAYTLSATGRFFADGIASSLFMIDDI